MGTLVSFEGADGCGKSSQIFELAKYLEVNAKSFVIYREPGATPLGEAIREILLHCPGEMHCRSEALLFMAARAELYQKVRWALKTYDFVLLDRSSDSSIAYQGYARGIPVDDLRQANEFAVEGLWPDITFLLDIDPRVGLLRASGGKGLDRIEAEGLQFQRKVRQGYLMLAEEEPDRIAVIDASGTVAEVASSVRQVLAERGYVQSQGLAR